MQLNIGTSVFHGTRWRQGDPKWWGPGKFPNRVGEDGGISFTLDVDATPKVKNAQIILEYSFRVPVNAVVCQSKAEFYAILHSRPSAVCYTRQEEEVVIHPDYLSHYLVFSEEWDGWR